MSTKSWKALKGSKLTAAGLERVRSRAEKEMAELSLKALREELNVTQSELSRSADMTQSELSRLESRSDHLTSTLRRYVEALGGELEISAVIGGRRVKLTKV